ncbi:MAG: DUF11 domain-containing protein [Acidobacteria bacterium]|nr:MAG: DUF11 domain-containing protein [Acidobacteriota bacterium]
MKDSPSKTHPRARLPQRAVLWALVASVGVAIVGRVWADYVGSLANRIFVDPASLSVIADGYDDGDVVSFILETTPADTGSLSGHAAWMTVYVPPGVEVVGAEYVQPLGDGTYATVGAEDTDDTYDGWGVRGSVGYTPSTGTTRLGEGFVNEVQQDTGIFYSTNSATALLATALTGLTPTGPQTKPAVVWNNWDYAQLDAFGTAAALSGNGGNGNTPVVSTDSGATWAGVGSMVAGPDTYYKNHYDPACDGTSTNFEDDVTCVGPWQRVATLNAKIGGSGVVAPATAAGSVQNTSVATSAGYSLSTTNALPATTNAVRYVHGARRLGELETARITFRITDATAFIAALNAKFCLDSTGGDTSDIAGKDNPWRYYEPAHQCTLLSANANLLKQILYVNGQGSGGGSLSVGDIIGYQIKYTNTSGNPLTNVTLTDTPDDTTRLKLVVDPSDGSDPATANCPYSSYNGTPSGPAYDLGASSSTKAVWVPVPSVAAGASFTVYLCAEVISGAEGNRVDNTASVTHTLPSSSTETLTSTAGGTISAKIAGHVYADVDLSGGYTTGDTALGGVTVQLYVDNDGDGKLSAGDTVKETTVTLSDGAYEFTGVAPGAYILVESDPSGYGSIADIDTAMGACATGNGCNTIGTITVVAAESHTGKDFFDTTPAATNTISGTVYVDVNSNQVYEPGSGEQGEPGVTVRLYKDNNNDGQVDAGDTLLETKVTDASGNYTFLLANQSGNFVMNIDTSTLPTGGSLTTDNVETANFVGNGNSDTNNNFGFIRPSAFSMTKASSCGAPTGCGGTTVNAGQIVTYTIGVTNTSSVGQFEVRVSDPLPNGTNYVLLSTSATGFTTTTTTATEDWESLSYSGGTGWVGDWTEINESDGAGKGDIKVKKDKGGNRIQIKKPEGLQRDVNLLNCSKATVSFIYRPNNIPAGYSVTLAADGTTIWTLNGPANSATYTNVSVAIPDSSLDAATTIRILGAGTGKATVLIDDILVSASCPVAATKTNASGSPNPLDNGTPANLVTAADGFYLAPGQSMSVTFQIIVNSPLNPAITQIVNTASVRSKSNPVPKTATVTDTVDQFTLATIASIVAIDDGGRASIVWETSSEIRTLGFYLLRYDWDMREWVMVNTELVQGLMQPQGGTYKLTDPGASLGSRLTYALAEIETNGGVRVHGPYEVPLGTVGAADAELSSNGKGRARVPKAKILKRLAKHRAEKKLHGSKKSSFASAIRVHVKESGLYFVDAAKIAEVFDFGLDLSKRLIRKNRLSLENLGHRVAWTPAPFNTGLYFYGEAIDDVYASENIYTLRIGRGLTMEKMNAGGVGASGGQSFLATTHREENKFGGVSVPHEPGADYWYWQFVTSDDETYGTRLFDLNVDGLAATNAAAELVVHLRGATTVGIPDEHLVEVSVNGYTVGESSWMGFDKHEARFSIPSSFLVEGENTVEVVGKRPPGVAYSIFYVDGFDLSYPRRYEARGSELFFGSANNTNVTVVGFTDPSIIVLELSNPRRPRLLDRVNVEADGAFFRASFRASRPDTAYIAASTAGIKMPVAITRDIRSRLRRKRNRADYLVIAPAELLDGAKALAKLRKRNGFRTMVVDLEDVYDEFSYGLETPEAVKAFLAYAYTEWSRAPRYVVLAGNGHFDHHDNWKLGGNLLPPLMVGTPEGLFASDSAFADIVGDDGVPEIALGRIPVLSNDELLDYVDKVRRYESGDTGPWANRILMLADNADARSNFPQDAERLIGFIPPDYDVDRVYLSQLTSAEARQKLFTALHEGVGHVHYFGHGGLDRLADESLLLISDVEYLVNQNYPIVTLMTCSVGRFGIPGFTPLAAELVQKAGGGAIAVWSPTGLSKHGQAGVLAERFFLASFGQRDMLLGDAIVLSLQEYALLGGTRAMLSLYQLIGDPALRPADLRGSSQN